jgi:hypothetical protein
VLERSACYVVCRPCALHIVEEWIIAQPSKDSESPILALDAYGVTRIAVNIVGVADPALNGVRHIEPAHEQRGSGRLAESLSAIDVEYVLQPIGKLMGDDVRESRETWLRRTVDRASTLTEVRFETRSELLRRARTRSAVHRFADALADIAAAEHAGANGDEIVALRSSILVATGHSAEVVPQLEANLVRHPGFASRTALAVAYAAIDRLEVCRISSSFSFSLRLLVF